MLSDSEIKARVQKALHRGGGTLSFEDIEAGLHSGKYQIFWNDHGVCVTEIVQGSQARFLNCIIVAGELPGVMDLHARVEAHGREHGCQWLQTTARRGWEVVLPNFGWKPTSTTFVRELSDG